MPIDELLRDIPVIDADQHVVEPYDLWTSRVSVKKWGDKVPHVVWDDELSSDVWMASGQYLGSPGKTATAGFDQPWPDHPKRWSEINPELWRATDRLGLMTRYGIHGAVLYPNISLFGNSHLSSAAEVDPQLGLDLVRAYNDFLIDYCSTDPQRYIPVMGVPFWDLDASLKEIERAAAAGHRGVIFSQQPELYGCPSLGDRHWDKVWALAQDLELPINFHIGSGATENKLLPPAAGLRANAASHPALQFLGNARAIAPMIGGGACHRFPDLKIVSVESGVGWIPFLLQALDVMWKESAVTREHPEYDLLPSEYFKRQMYACFWFEHGEGLDAAISYLGDEHILYETDFPHPAGMNPGPASSMVTATEFISQNLSYLPEPTLRRILHDNSAALYKVD